MNKTVKIAIEIGLLVVAAVIAWFWIAGIQRKIDFDKETKVRYTAVVKDFMNLREIQVAYRSKYGEYCGKWDKLEKFYKNDSLTIINKIGDIEDSAAVAQGKVRWDTIQVAVHQRLKQEEKIIEPFNIDSLRYIPYSNNEVYSLQKGEVMTASKVSVKVFEANATCKQILYGLDYQYIINESEMREKKFNFPGIRVGNMEEANNNAGNWE